MNDIHNEARWAAKLFKEFPHKRMAKLAHVIKRDLAHDAVTRYIHSPLDVLHEIDMFRFGCLKHLSGEAKVYAADVERVAMLEFCLEVCTPYFIKNTIRDRLFKEKVDAPVTNLPHSVMYLCFEGSLYTYADRGKKTRGPNIESIVLFDGTPYLNPGDAPAYGYINIGTGTDSAPLTSGFTNNPNDPESIFLTQLIAFLDTVLVAYPRRPTAPHSNKNKRKQTQKKDVYFVDLRRYARDNDVPFSNGDDTRGYTCRFVVSGHWRNQARGEGRRERRRTWIKPFIKGPEDAPMKPAGYNLKR